MVRPAMRIVLLLTFGLPVLASQLVALAAPKIEAVLCAKGPRISGEPSVDRSRPVTALRLQLPASVLVVASPLELRVEQPLAPEGSSARALTFVKHAYAQAT
jgi:hypothetical protein